MTFWLMTIAAIFVSGLAAMFARELAATWDAEPIMLRMFGVVVFGWFLGVVGMLGYFAASMPS